MDVRVLVRVGLFVKVGLDVFVKVGVEVGVELVEVTKNEAKVM